MEEKKERTRRHLKAQETSVHTSEKRYYFNWRLVVDTSKRVSAAPPPKKQARITDCVSRSVIETHAEKHKSANLPERYKTFNSPPTTHATIDRNTTDSTKNVLPSNRNVSGTPVQLCKNRCEL